MKAGLSCCGMVLAAWVHVRQLCCLVVLQVGLQQSLGSLEWHHASNHATFYPRAYCLSDEADVAAFDADFRWTAARSVLQRCLLDGGFCAAGVPDAATFKVGSLHAEATHPWHWAGWSCRVASLLPVPEPVMGWPCSEWLRLPYVISDRTLLTPCIRLCCMQQHCVPSGTHKMNPHVT
jgi:hypothetical protein